MTLDQFKAFLEKVKGDPSLAASIESATSADELIAIAKAEGFALDKALLKSAFSSAISEEDLESVSGGGRTEANTCVDLGINLDGINDAADKLGNEITSKIADAFKNL